MKRGPDGYWFCPDCGTHTNFNGDRTPRHNCFARPQEPPRTTPCEYFGPRAGTVPCNTCKGDVRIKVNVCTLLGGLCLPAGVAPDGVVACLGCDKYAAKKSFENS